MRDFLKIFFNVARCPVYTVELSAVGNLAMQGAYCSRDIHYETSLYNR